MDGQSALVPAVMLPMALLNPVYHRILCGGRKQKKKRGNENDEECIARVRDEDAATAAA